MTARPDSPEVADAAGSWRSAYVHIPFCSRRCPYCDFAVVTPVETEVPHRDYVQAVITEIGMSPPWEPLDAISVGGGTPSVVDPALLGDVLAALDARFGLAPGAEIGLEANPEDWRPRRAEALREAGFRRVSFGAQSFDPIVLDALGRNHEPADIDQAVATARACGFESVNLDLIFGTPGESVASWSATLDRALSLEPDHLSTYALTVERGTELSRSVLDGSPAPDPDDQADKYELAQEAIGRAGLVQYEVSNHARPGHHVRYNLGTWAGGEYVGVGLGAHGHRSGVRTRNIRRLDRYMEAVGRGELPHAGVETVADPAREAVFLGLRRMAGVQVTPVVAAFLESPEGERFVEAGVVDVNGGRLRITRPLLADAVMREFVG
ncbi:MAG: radical SAM family heme chaperone HemW [Acidimicrobiia bacterium]|nr:radical SAM family heme chaperone HemW [Acidimicrobiia bacterium]